MFEEALQKYGKDFSDIQKDFVSSSLCGFINFMMNVSVFRNFKLHSQADKLRIVVELLSHKVAERCVAS